MKKVIFLFLIIFSITSNAQNAKDILIDTYNVGYFDSENKYVFMKEAHNVFTYLSTKNKIIITNLFNEDSKSIGTLNVFYIKYYDKEKLTTYSANFETNSQDTLLFIVPDQKQGEKRVSFAVVYKKIMYQFN